MAPPSHQTHYEILGITRQAQLKEVRDAYRKLALKFHPDKDPRNPRAVATFQKLGAAYEVLSDESRRTKYDATLPRCQRVTQPPQPADWPSQRSSGPSPTTQERQEELRRRQDWWAGRNWSTSAREWAARREDDAYWSGPTYAHGATDRSGWDKQSDWEQKNGYEFHEQRQRQRAARKEARKEAERKQREMNTTPPRDVPSNQGTDEAKTQAESNRKDQKAREKAERDAREDDGGRGRPPSPQRPEPDWSDRVEKEYQERLEKEKKERADRRRQEREQLEKEWPAELPRLLSKIISIEADIQRTEAKVDESKSATKDEREDEDHEQIFDLPIKRKFMQRRLNECLDEYKRILKWLRSRSREQEADEAGVKLRKARKEIAKEKTAGHNGNSQEEQADSKTKKKTKVRAEEDQVKPPADTESSYLDPKSSAPRPSKSSSPRGVRSGNAEQPPKTTLPMYDAPSDGDARPSMSHDGSGPDRGFTGEMPEPSIVGNDHDYDDEDYDPPFCNDFHDSHMEVHREFWDILDFWHECSFCHRVCTVMRCPKCDAQACAYCKDRYG